MIKIASDDKAIEKCIRKLEASVLEHGGWLDPGLVINCEGGSLSVEKHTFQDPRNPLIAVPQEMLLPEDKINMAVKGDDFVIDPAPGALTDLQRETAETMMELYNLTDKVKLHRESCCWLSFRDNTEALEALKAARSPNKKHLEFFEYTKGEKTDDKEKIECESFIKSRTIGLKNVKGEEPDVMKTFIMPIIDFLNHHIQGANFNLSKGEEAPEVEKYMQVRDSRPNLHSHECYANYNMLDAVDSFLSYGFADTSAPFIRSVPVEIEIEKIGKFIVQSHGYNQIRQRLHKNIAGLRPYIPTTLQNEEGLLAVTHMIIPTTKASPNAMRRVLRMLISGKAARIYNAQQIWEKVLEVEEQIIQANTEFYNDLIKKADRHLEKGADKHWQLVKDIALIQQSLLSKYLFEESHFADTEIFDPDHQADMPPAVEAAE